MTTTEEKIEKAMSDWEDGLLTSYERDQILAEAKAEIDLHIRGGDSLLDEIDRALT
jgi:hypothetical protein